MTDHHADPFEGWDETDPFAAQAAADEDTAHSAPPEEEIEKTLDPKEVRDFLRLYVLQRVVNDAIGDFIGARKASADEVLEVAARQLGTSQFTISVPTIEDIEEDVAKITAKKSKPKTTITDQGDFTEWLTKNHPDLVETEDVPEKTVPAHTETRIKTTAVTTITKDATLTRDGDVITPDGEPVPGLTHTPGGRYDGHTLTWGGTGSPGKEKALRLLLNNRIKALTATDVIAAAALEKKDKP